VHDCIALSIVSQNTVLTMKFLIVAQCIWSLQHIWSLWYTGAIQAVLLLLLLLWYRTLIQMRFGIFSIFYASVL